MQLKTKIIDITDAHGNEIDIEDVPVALYLNGKPHERSLSDVITEADYDDGQIECNTLLSFYKVQKDGSLHVEGSTIQLFNTATKEFILVKEISRPFLNDDDDISFEEVRKFAHDFAIAKPHEVFTDLNDEDKQVFIAEIEKREAETQKEKAEATKALAEAEAAQKEKEKEDADQADKKLRESLDASTVHDEKGYLKVQSYYKSKKCDEKTTNPFHVFFGKDSGEEPCLLIKRGNDWWEEPEQTAWEGENAKELIIEFNDLGTKRELVFNTETGEIKVKE